MAVVAATATATRRLRHTQATRIHHIPAVAVRIPHQLLYHHRVDSASRWQHLPAANVGGVREMRRNEKCNCVIVRRMFVAGCGLHYMDFVLCTHVCYTTSECYICVANSCWIARMRGVSWEGCHGWTKGVWTMMEVWSACVVCIAIGWPS